MEIHIVALTNLSIQNYLGVSCGIVEISDVEIAAFSQKQQNKMTHDLCCSKRQKIHSEDSISLYRNHNTVTQNNPYRLMLTVS